MEYAHDLLEKHGIPHRFSNDTYTEHTWTTKWLVPLLNDLVEMDGIPQLYRFYL